jgi:hypothetical protein
VDFILSSSSAEADVRTVAVKELVKSIIGKKPEDIEDLVSETICDVMLRSLMVSRILCGVS